eukprot:NODE_2138_length_1282_cov_38.693431_g1945_i0.p1 GENE.NODE_2138_length_1282_cov_38.693431_g1945_i0~~NODE_2138_length_1282_cov_38.693431_g1945_i0.p1  ORF type:complete len:394 (+),score=67.74 NODE_2138_length_1282_cov_38.693431_g1945_i0:49-1182(+)
MGDDGTHYEGEFSDNRRHGHGTLLQEGLRYVGGFCRHKFHGEGLLELSNGDVMEGEFEMGLLSGRGMMRTGIGEEYEGFFASGKRHGQGRFSVASLGFTYDGLWAADQPVGAAFKMGWLQAAHGDSVITSPGSLTLPYQTAVVISLGLFRSELQDPSSELSEEDIQRIVQERRNSLQKKAKKGAKAKESSEEELLAKIREEVVRCKVVHQHVTCESGRKIRLSLHRVSQDSRQKRPSSGMRRKSVLLAEASSRDGALDALPGGSEAAAFAAIRQTPPTTSRATDRAASPPGGKTRGKQVSRQSKHRDDSSEVSPVWSCEASVVEGCISFGDVGFSRSLTEPGVYCLFFEDLMPVPADSEPCTFPRPLPPLVIPLQLQ